LLPASAAAAAISETNADDDATATAADVVTTNADVVITNADVVTTNADVVLTGLDVVTTNADVVLTGLDVVTTNADAVTTTQDAIDTAADVVTTNADAATTTQDAIDTAADVVFTNADVVSSAASASAAGISETNAGISETNAAASAAGVNLPSAVASTFLQQKSDVSGYETQTITEVKATLETESWKKADAVPKTANYTIQDTDNGDIIRCNGTFTITGMTASAANDGFVVGVNNAGTGVITLSGVSGLTKLSAGQSCTLWVDWNGGSTPLVKAIVSASGGIIGSSIMMASNNVPANCLYEDGSAVSRTTYAALFAEIGTTWGSGNGTTTFNVPDSRERYKRCAGTTNAVGATLANQNKSHKHSASTGSDSHTHQLTAYHNSVTDGTNPYGGSTTGGLYRGTFTTTSDSHSHSVSIGYEGGTEARPDSACYKSCIVFE